jgi:hypothetical protein
VDLIPLNYDTVHRLKKLGYRYLIFDSTNSILRATKEPVHPDRLRFLSLIEFDIDLLEEDAAHRALIKYRVLIT